MVARNEPAVAAVQKKGRKYEKERERDTEAKRADGNTFREREEGREGERNGTRRRQRWRIREK